MEGKQLKLIDECRDEVVGFYKRMELPHTLPEIKEYLLKRFETAIECDCPRCKLRAYATSEAYVLLEELAKVVPAENINAVAGLFCRFHESRLGLLKMTIEEAEEKVEKAGKAIGSALNGLMGKAGFIEVKGEQAQQMLEVLRSAIDGNEQTDGEEVDPESKPEAAPVSD